MFFKIPNWWALIICVFGYWQNALATLVKRSGEEASRKLLQEIFSHHLQKCSVVIAFQESYQNSQILTVLSDFPIPKQILEVKSASDFRKINWNIGFCVVYLLLDNPLILPNFVDTKGSPWDYNGKYIIISKQLNILENFSNTVKAKKTEHIYGIVQNTDTVTSYTTKFYWDEGIEVFPSTGHKAISHYFFDKISKYDYPPVKVASFGFPPSVFYERDRNGKVTDIYGTEVSAVKAILNSLKWKSEFIQPKKGEKWGKRVNGTWDGIVGLVLFNKADIGVANFYMNINRSKVMDLSHPLDNERVCFLSRVPPFQPKWLSIVLPFTVDAWIVIVVSIFICSIVLAVFLRTTSRVVVEAFTFSLQAHVKSPASIAKTSNYANSTRIFLGLLWLYCIILTTSYSSNLIAFLTIPRRSKAFDTLEGLFNSGLTIFEFGTAPHSIYAEPLSKSTDPVNVALSKRFKNVPTIKAIVEDVLDNKGVFVQSRSYIEFMQAIRMNGQGRIMKECFLSYNIALILDKNSPLTKIINKKIRRIGEAGLPRRWFLEGIQRYKTQVTSEGGNKERVEEQAKAGISLSLDHLQGAFFILMAMEALSVIVFVLEIVCVKWHKN